MNIKKIISWLLILFAAGAVVYFGSAYLKTTSFSIASFYDSLKEKPKKDTVDDGSGITVKETKYKANFEIARWEGYEKLSFKELLREGMPKALDPNDKTIRTTLTITEDWKISDGYGMDMILTEGCQPATYRIDVSNSNPDLDLSFCFFVEFDENKMALVIKGVLSTSKNMAPVTLTGQDAVSLVEEIKAAL